MTGDKYSREKLENAKNKLMEFREASDFLDKERVDCGRKKPVNGGGTYHQDFREGSPLHLGDEEDDPHQVNHGTIQTVSEESANGLMGMAGSG